jgi:hypothetical protein
VNDSNTTNGPRAAIAAILGGEVITESVDFGRTIYRAGDIGITFMDNRFTFSRNGVISKPHATVIGALQDLQMQELASRPCPLCAGTGKEHDGDSWQKTPCACVGDAE